MPILNYTTRQMNISVHSKFVKGKIFEMSMPFSPHKAMNGYYSKLWRKMKPDAIAGFGVKESTVTRLTVSGRNETGNNVTIKFASGIAIVFPANADKEDLEIIIAYLELLRRTCRK